MAEQCGRALRQVPLDPVATPGGRANVGAMTGAAPSSHTRSDGVRMAPARAPLATVVAALAGRVTRTEPQRVFTTLARNRRLFRRWLPFAGGLLRGDLPRADTELLI